MPLTFWAGYVGKLAIAGLVLCALYLLARRVRAMPLFRVPGRRVELIESAALSPHAALHVVRADARCYLIGTGGATMLAEMRGAELDVKVSELADLVPGALHEVDLAIQAQR